MVDTLEEGKTMRRLPRIRSAPARYGLVRPVTPWRQCRMRGAGTAGGAGGKFRILERHQWKGMDFATRLNPSANSPKNTTSNTSELIHRPRCRRVPARALVLSRRAHIRYTPEMKTAMVLKAKDVIAVAVWNMTSAPPTSPARLWLPQDHDQQRTQRHL